MKDGRIDSLKSRLQKFNDPFLRDTIKDLITLIETGASGGSGGTTNHAELNNLSYANSKHVGFQPALGFNPENILNKKLDLSDDSDAYYVSQKGIATALNAKENVENKSTDGTLADNSDTKYSSQKAVKTYADTKLAKKTDVTDINDAGIADGHIAVFNKTNKDIRTNGLLVGTAANNLVQLDGDAKLPAVDGSNLLNVSSDMPIGSIRFSTSNDKRDNEMEMDGSELSRVTYAELNAIYAAEGYPWGNGDGSTTFNIPDGLAAALRIVGTSTQFTQDVTIALAQVIDDMMQGHYHSVNDPSHRHSMTNSFLRNLSGSAVLFAAGGNGLAYATYCNYSSTGLTVRSPSSDGVNGTPRVGNETTGKAIGVYAFIRVY